MDASSLAASMAQTQTALTMQQLGVATQKMAAEAQQATADLIVSQTQAVAAAPSGPSANSAITGRGQVLDISV